MRVELLFWDADPEYMTARQKLVEVLIEDAFETPIQMIAVSTAEDAEFLALPGSPTIRIDGADIDPDGAGDIGLYLRSYPAEAAGSGGEAAARTPSKALIRRAVDRARGWSHGRPEASAAVSADEPGPQ
jgi:hypothetical protein